jgi:hypothetical protein
MKFELKQNGEVIKIFEADDRKGMTNKAEEYLNANHEGVFRKFYEDSYSCIGWYGNGSKFTLEML